MDQLSVAQIKLQVAEHVRANLFSAIFSCFLLMLVTSCGSDDITTVVAGQGAEPSTGTFVTTTQGQAG